MCNINYEININYLFGVRLRKRDYVNAWCNELYNKYGNHLIIIGENTCIAYTNNWDIYIACDYFNIIMNIAIKSICALPSNCSYTIMMDILNIDMMRLVYKRFLEIFSYKRADVIDYMESRRVYSTLSNPNYVIERIDDQYIIRKRELNDYLISAFINGLGYKQADTILNREESYLRENPIIPDNEINAALFDGYTRKLHAKLSRMTQK